VSDLSKERGAVLRRLGFGGRGKRLGGLVVSVGGWSASFEDGGGLTLTRAATILQVDWELYRTEREKRVKVVEQREDS
jgi:hypothetical protein